MAFTKGNTVFEKLRVPRVGSQKFFLVGDKILGKALLSTLAWVESSTPDLRPPLQHPSLYTVVCSYLYHELTHKAKEVLFGKAFLVRSGDALGLKKLQRYV